MAILGVLARIDVPQRDRIVGELDKLDGITPFALEDQQHRLGILVEGPTLAAAREMLGTQIEPMAGILGTWPVFSHFESDTAATCPDDVPWQRALEKGAGDGQDAP